MASRHGARQPRNSWFPLAAALGLGLSSPKTPSAEDHDVPCYAWKNSLFECVGNMVVTS